MGLYQVALCGVNSACVSALTAGMRCLASRAALPRALGYGHFGRGQVSGDCAVATLRRCISGPELRRLTCCRGGASYREA